MKKPRQDQGIGWAGQWERMNEVNVKAASSTDARLLFDGATLTSSNLTIPTSSTYYSATDLAKA